MTYEIRTINDLMKVPADRLDNCLKQIKLTLHAAALAIGSENSSIECVTWTDDDDPSVTAVDESGAELFSLKVTKDGE